MSVKLDSTFSFWSQKTDRTFSVLSPQQYACAVLRPNSPGPLMDDSSVNFHDVFFIIFCYNLAKNEEKTSWKFMDDSSVTFQSSISGPGEFGLRICKGKHQTNFFDFDQIHLVNLRMTGKLRTTHP